MQVSNPNNVKIYNLSAGKSLPEWLSDRRKRLLQKKDVDIQRKVELLQDFEMPTVCNYVKVSNDGKYIIIAGTYKPRVRCFDVADMSMKFERGLDSEVVKFLVLSEDYSKILFLQNDRYIEFHSQFGRYYRTRIPKFGRDLDYHYPSCDLYFVGVTPQVFRFNLEQGRFLAPLETSASTINCCQFNPDHYLFSCGTQEGQVECWDPRSRRRAGILDCALSNHIESLEVGTVPSVTAIKYCDGLNMAVGTSTGHILLYDLRSHKPLLVKDHQYELPIKDIIFHQSQDLVLSMDKKIVKLWHKNTGKAFTAIEPGTDLNNLCLYKNSGLLFIANEAPKMFSYYLPALGTAPKWCSFLDSLTEELEENESATIYDDYKFVTRKELQDIGLEHLIGSNLLRASMHGFFLDIRLYHKAKSIAEPFAYDQYRKDKIKEKIDQERANRVRLKKLPKVNRQLAEKILDSAQDGNEKKGKTVGLMKDDRFSAMFKNPDFQIDPNSDEYKVFNPAVVKLDKMKKKKRQENEEHIEEQFDEVNEEIEGKPSDDDDVSSSSDDEHNWKQEFKKEKKSRKNETGQNVNVKTSSKFYEIKSGEVLKNTDDKKSRRKVLKKALHERLTDAAATSVAQEGDSAGNKEMVFKWKTNEKEVKRLKQNKLHHDQRKKLRRSAHEITKNFKSNPKYWMGKRVQ